MCATSAPARATEPRDQHAGLVEPRAHQAAGAVAHEVVGRRTSTRRSRRSGLPGSGRPTEPIFLPRRVGEHDVRLGRRVDLEHADRPNRSTSRRHTSARMPLPANSRTGLLFSPSDRRRVDEAAAHLAGVEDDRRRRSAGPRPRTSADRSALASASRAPPTSALPVATSVPDGWCSGRQQYTVSRVVSVAAAAAPSAENAQRRFVIRVRARRLGLPRDDEHHREIARAARVGLVPGRQRDRRRIDRLHVDRRRRGSTRARRRRLPTAPRRRRRARGPCRRSPRARARRASGSAISDARPRRARARAASTLVGRRRATAAPRPRRAG